MSDRYYLTIFLLIAAALLFLGRGELPASNLLTWGLTFGVTTTAGVLLVALYRVREQLKRSRHELARKDAEISFALEVQRALFPRDLSGLPGLEIAAVCLPAQGISGDYYEVLVRQDGQVVFALADISGKGVSAAILMANLQALFRMLQETREAPDQICNRLNRHLCNVTEANRFATLFVGEWRPSTRTLRYVNAGHEIPLVFGVDHEPSEGGPPVGIFEDFQYRSGSVQLPPGTLLVIYSDGVVEARNPKDEEFGVDRLRRVISGFRDAPLEDIEAAVLKAVEDWSQGSREDDTTLMLVRVQDESEMSGDGDLSLKLHAKAFNGQENTP